MVGPWGWAARMRREDLLVSTAILMGHDFELFNLHRRIFRLSAPYIPPQQWEIAEVWLHFQGIEFDGTE